MPLPVRCSWYNFLNAKNVCQAEIHKKIVEVYGEGAVDEGNARKWCQLTTDCKKCGVTGDSQILNYLNFFGGLGGGGQSLRSDHRQEMLWSLKASADTFCDEGVGKLVAQYDRHLNLRGNYVGK